MESLALHAQAVSVDFDGIKALDSVDLDIDQGRVTGLIGPNGAGKTTLVNVLTGFQRPSQGSVQCGSMDITELPEFKIRRIGVARTFQGGRLFSELSVLDNLAVTGVGLGHSRADSAREAHRILDWFDIAALSEKPAGILPYTDERRVSIARALMFQPDFLLLDEPAAGMSEDEAFELAALIRHVVEKTGCGVLLIEHNIGLVLSVSEHIYVLDSGSVVEQGAAETIRNSDIVRHAYMGTQSDGQLSERNMVGLA